MIPRLLKTSVVIATLSLSASLWAKPMVTPTFHIQIQWGSAFNLSNKPMSIWTLSPFSSFNDRVLIEHFSTSVVSPSSLGDFCGQILCSASPTSPAMPVTPLAESQPPALQEPQPTCTEETSSSWGYQSFPTFFRGNPSCTKNLIVTNKQVYYQGDPLQVYLKFPKSLTAVINGEADAYMLIAPPAGDIIVAPVAMNPEDIWYKFLELADLDTSQFAVGNYQLAVVLTQPGGDPLVLADWYRGLKGLISTKRIKMWAGYSYDAEDEDGDGQIDGDWNGDGYCEVASRFHRRRGIHFFFGKPGCKENLIVPNKRVYYPGDPLHIYLEFPRALQSVLAGDAQAHIVIVPPVGDLIVVPVQPESYTGMSPFLELAQVDTSNLLPGNYQIGLILTENAHEPVNLNHWYDSFRGLVSITRIKVSEGCDDEDRDHDGMIDGDTNNDGFSDDTLPEEEPDDLETPSTQPVIDEPETKPSESTEPTKSLVEKTTPATQTPVVNPPENQHPQEPFVRPTPQRPLTEVIQERENELSTQEPVTETTTETTTQDESVEEESVEEESVEEESVEEESVEEESVEEESVEESVEEESVEDEAETTTQDESLEDESSQAPQDEQPKEENEESENEQSEEENVIDDFESDQVLERDIPEDLSEEDSEFFEED